MSDVRARLALLDTVLDDAATPVDVAEVLLRVQTAPVVSDAPPPRVRPAWAAVAAAAAAVLVVLGAVPLLLGTSGEVEPGESAVEPAPALGAGWEHIESVEGASLAASTDLGLVVAGFTDHGPGGGADVWHSSDAEFWTKVTGIERDPNVYITGLTAGGPGFVAVGNELFGGSTRGLVWTSTDGLNWEQNLDSILPLGPCASMESVEANRDAVVAIGCGGGIRDSYAVWHSTDGVSWETEPLPGGAASLVLAAGESGFLVLGFPEVVAFSPDGHEWRAVTVDGPPGNGGRVPAVGVDGLLLQGGTLDGHPMVWASTDQGRTWKETEMRLEADFPLSETVVMHDLIASPYGYVGVGMLGEMDEAFEENPEAAQGFIIHSWDGSDWTAMALDSAPPFTELAASDDAIYATFAGYGHWIWSPKTTDPTE